MYGPATLEPPRTEKKSTLTGRAATLRAGPWPVMMRPNPRLRFEPWLFSIARNLAIDHLRKQQTATARYQMCPEDEAGLNLPAPDFESPFFAAARSEDAKRIAAALGALEPIYREVLLLRFQEELSLAEIAQVAGAPISTVSSRIHRGLSMLQASLGGGADAA
jgi:RNA polymerase sigma-70 factor (ECF subfamily)